MHSMNGWMWWSYMWVWWFLLKRLFSCTDWLLFPCFLLATEVSSIQHGPLWWRVSPVSESLLPYVVVVVMSVCPFGQKWNASEGKQYLYCISFRLIFKLPWFPLCLLHYINLCEVFFIIKRSGLCRSFVLLPVAGICFGLKGRFQYCNLVWLLMWCYISDTLYHLPWFL
jgi:hypothetical protein